MSLTELFPSIRTLSRADKLRLMQFLLVDLAREEGVLLEVKAEDSIYTPLNTSMEERKTQGVYNLVEDILATFSRPYSEDVIEEVFLAIEGNPQWQERYEHLSSDLRSWVANNWIGQWTKEITGGETIREVNAKRSKLIKNYTKLQY